MAHPRPIALALLLGACDASPSPASAPAPTATASGAALPPYCADKKREMTGYGVPWDDALTLPLPAGFPAPPASATLCGTTPTQHIAYYHLAGVARDEVLAPYRAAIPGLGLHVNQGGIAEVVSFDNLEAPGSGRYEGGSVAYYAEQGELKLVYRKD